MLTQHTQPKSTVFLFRFFFIYRFGRWIPTFACLYHCRCGIFVSVDFLRFSDFLFVSGHRKRAVSIGTILFFFFFIGYPENAKYPPDKNCVSFSGRKFVRKLAYPGVRNDLTRSKTKSS